MSVPTPIDVARKVARQCRLQWVPLSKMKVSAVAQRDLNQARVDRIVARFDEEMIGSPIVNERGGEFYVIDGQHRVEALRALGWDERSVQCWTYHGLTEHEEADYFLKFNDTLAVHAFDKFRVAVEAGRPDECEINRVVRAANLCVSRDKVPGAIGAVGTLRRVWNRSGSSVLSRTLRIIRDAYGDEGLDAVVIDGIGLVVGRYETEIKDADVVQRLAAARGGLGALINRSNVLHQQMGNQKGHCVAAAAVELINRGKGGKKLPSWWREV